MEIFKENEKTINFNAEKDDVDIKQFLGKQQLSSRLFRKLYKEKNIFVNGKFRRKGLKIRKGDIISIYMEDELDNTRPENFNIDIIYEDFDLLILNKEPNMVVHLTRSYQENTLSNGVSNYFKNNNIKRKIRFVNRLDRNTTGLLIVAKNSFAHHQLSLQFQKNQIERKYLAVVSGIMEKDEGYIDCPIGRKEGKGIQREVTESGQESLSKYTLKERYKENSLVEVQIFTGRTHQIRVHLSHIGYPIIGDNLYGGKSQSINRQALHSYYLKLKQPRTKLEIEIMLPLPDDMTRLLDSFQSK